MGKRKVMMYKQILLFILVSLVCQWPPPVSSHGRLWIPPGRSTMWRLPQYRHRVPVNYDDNQLYCGGFRHQLSLGYKCGICGDPYDGVRENEAGGKYAKGIITGNYTQGQETTFQVQLTRNHLGFFEFRICPTNNPHVKATQECLNRFPVALADNSGYKFYPGSKDDYIDIPARLPADLACDFCVLQWRYHAGNNFGTDPDGRSCKGCGPQEEFYGCADIRILRAGSAFVAPPMPAPTPTPAPAPTPAPTTRHDTEHSQGCRGLGPYATVKSINDNCRDNCPHNCSPHFCECPK